MTKVAVVAVHGVADQKPAASARAVARLLEQQPGFSKFVESPITVPLAPLTVGPPASGDESLDYMTAQLQKYAPPAGRTHGTVRLDGTRGGPNPATVHVYEVYWADLSRAGETWYRLLAEFYQLILHLPSLGRNGVRAARARHKTFFWTLTSWLQESAVWLLTVSAALLNVAILSLGIVALSAEVPTWLQPAVAMLPFFAIVATAAVIAFRKLGAPAVLWYATPFALVAAAAGSVFLLKDLDLYRWLAIEGAVVGFAAAAFIAWKYQPMKKSALAFGVVTALIAHGIVVSFIITGPDTEAGTYIAAISAAQRMYWGVVLTWVLVFATGTLAGIAGLLAIATSKKGARQIAYRVTWAARFSLGLPVALFAVFTLAIWLVIVRAIAAMAPDDAILLWKPPLIPLQVETYPVSIQAAMHTLLLDSANGLEVFVIALACFAVAAVWAATPSVLAEVKHPINSNPASTSLGKWLSRGLKLIAWAGEFLTLPLVLMLLIASGVIPPWLQQAQTATLLSAASVVVVALFTGKYFIGPFRAAVDILLDVDNYLRESPSNATPRAQIAERFASMLRYVCTAAPAYDHIVIVAHSQGTVISADTLRYMTKFGSLPAAVGTTTGLRLFTMGSPLRQMYAKAFPYLYGWMGDATAPQPAVPYIIPNAEPRPQDLSVEKWANAYCTGDYVGREIWLDERHAHLHVRPAGGALHVADDGVGSRIQFCAGAGAHTHYWDVTQDDVGQHLAAMV